MSSSDNSQFEPQAGLRADPPVMSDPLAPVSLVGHTVVFVPRDPVWSGWDVLLIALLTLGALFIVEFLTILGARALVYPHASFMELAQKPILALVGEFLAYIAVAAYMVMLVKGKYHAPFWKAIHWNWRGNAMFGFLGLGVLTVSLDLLSRYLPMPKSTPFDQLFAHPRDAYLTAAFAVTVGPLMEEVFFRGFLYPVLARRTGAVLAVILTALPFGMVHYVQYKSWAAVLVIALVGAVLTIVRAVTKSVSASFLVHVGYNATLMTLAAIATDGFRHMEKAVFLYSFLP